MIKIYYTQRKMLSKALLKEVFEKYYHINICAKDIKYTKNGKPALVAGEYHFSVTHTDGIIMMAVSDSPCGLDVELKNRNVDHLRIIGCYYKDKENYRDCSLEDFIVSWVAKEAFIKYQELTIAKNLKHISYDLRSSITTYKDENCNIEIGFINDYIYALAPSNEKHELINIDCL